MTGNGRQWPAMDGNGRHWSAMVEQFSKKIGFFFPRGGGTDTLFLNVFQHSTPAPNILKETLIEIFYNPV
jgi:hypothetical protein